MNFKYYEGHKASLTRHGKGGAPQYSIYSRTKSAVAFNVPGPGTYRNENVKMAYKAAPNYSLASRAKSSNANRSPGTIAQKSFNF